MLRNQMMDPEGSASNTGGWNMADDSSWYTGDAGDYMDSPARQGFAQGAMPMGASSAAMGFEEEDYDNEPPLLEELGINFEHILTKTAAVLVPLRPVSENILDDADLAGPLVFGFALGVALLLSGKVHFGYVYGFSLFGCVSLYAILSLMSRKSIDVTRVMSVLGYCMLPVLGLACISIVLDLRGVLGFILSAITILWSTFSSTRMFDAALSLSEQYWLIAYPVALLYSCFVLITVF